MIPTTGMPLGAVTLAARKMVPSPPTVMTRSVFSARSASVSRVLRRANPAFVRQRQLVEDRRAQIESLGDPRVVYDADVLHCSSSSQRSAGLDPANQTPVEKRGKSSTAPE